tara:strand:- start:3489 stop:3827 length:339 start_codon:yes stop_codon:yes gene_type:complete
MPTVYITQEVERWDIFPARKFGDVKAILPSTAQVVLSAAPTLRKIRRALKDFTNEDYLLMSGDPIIMGLCMMVATDLTQGQLRLLKWDKREKDYYEVLVDYHDMIKEESIND